MLQESINKMKMMSVMLLVMCMFLVVAPMVSSEQQSQSYSKVYMNPLYRQSMSQNTNYTYELVVDTPDGIDFVSNAMVTMQLWLNPTIEFFVWVNGQTCNNPSYEVHTTYAGAGEGTIFFDCSNIITKEGTYNVTLQPDDNTGASTFWVDLTYSNLPRPQMTFGGTDYFSFEPNQLVFVQLIDNTESGNPIDNAVCFAEVYSSDGNSHIIEDAPMVHTEHGLYHLHTAITEVGVHMIAVECYFQFNNTIYNVSGTTTTSGNYQRLSGNVPYSFFEYDGGTITNKTSFVTALDTNFTEIRHDWTNKYAKLNSTSIFSNGDVVKMYARNINKLGDTIYLHNLAGTVIYGSYVIDTVSVYEWNNVTLANAGAGVNTIYISDLSQGGAHDIRWDYIEVASLTGGGWFGNPDTNNTLSHLNLNDNLYWQIVESSGDLLDVEFSFSGLTGLYNDTANLDISAIWSGTENLNISAYNVTSASWVQLPNKITTSIGETDYNNVLNSFSNYVNASGTLRVRIQDTLVDTDYGLLKIDSLNLEIYEGQGAFVDDVKGGGEVHIINASGITQDVWSAPTRSLTELNFDTTDEEAIWEYQGNVSTNLLNQFAGAFWNWTGSISTTIGDFISNAVWTAPNRSLSDFNFTVNTTVVINATDIANEVWNNPNRTLTDYNHTPQIDLTNYSQIQDLVSQYSNNLSAGDVWSYINRTLTDYNHTAQLDLTNYTLVQDLISQYGNDLTAQLIWEYTNRNLTYYPPQVDLTNYTQVENLIALYSNNLTSDDVWNNVNRNLTDFNFTVDINLNLTEVAESIWSYTNRTLTDYNHTAQLDLTNYTLVQDLISQYGNDLTAELVWNYSTRNLTFYPAQVDLTNYTLVEDLITQFSNNLSAGDIWNYANRNLTFYDDPTNYTLIGDLITALGNNNSDLTNYTLVADLITQLGNDDNTNYTLVQNIVTTYGNDDNANYTLIQDLITTYGNDDNTNYTLISDMVWSATTRTLTNFNFTVDVNQTLIADAVWSAVNRTLTSTQFTDTTNYTLIQDLITSYGNNLTEDDIWQFGARNLTYYPVQTDLTNYTLINEGVWAYNNRTLTYYEVANPNNLSAQEIWEYANRNLTFYPVQVDLTNYSLVGDSVWNALNRTLSDFNFTVTLNNSELVEDVWSYFNRTLTETSDPFNYSYMQGLVWNFTDRELTNIDWSGFNATVNTTINYSDIADNVWSHFNRTLTDYNHSGQVDLTNYSLVQELVTNFGNDDNTNYSYISDVVWNATTRTLSDFNFTVEANVNVSEIADAVWNSVNRTLTDYNQSSQFDLTDYALIQTMVWNATVRTLTDYDHQTQLDLTDYDLIQDKVWNATVRELTYYPTANLTLSNASIQALGDAVWNYNGTINSNILNQVAENVQCYLSNILGVNDNEWSIDIKSC